MVIRGSDNSKDRVNNYYPLITEKMTLSSVTQRQIRNIEIITGLSIVLMAVLAGISFGMVFMKIFVKHDPSSTLELLIQNETQYRLSVLGWMGILILDLVISWGVYYIFKTTHSPAALLAAILRFAYTMFLAIALAYQIDVLNILEMGKSLLIQEDKMEYFVYSALFSFESNWNFGLILFSLHLGTVAFLCFKIRGIKILGFLVGIAALGYLIFPLVKLINPQNILIGSQFENFYSIPMALGELSLGVWLLAKKRSS